MAANSSSAMPSPPMNGALTPCARNCRKIKPPGLFALYVSGYSFGRIFEELLRVDPAHHILGLRLNFFVAVVLCALGAAWFVRSQRAGARRARNAGPGAAVLAAGPDHRPGPQP